MFTNKKLIIFDLDGTLINSIPDLTIALNIMLETYKLPALTIKEVTPFVGNGAKPLVRRALEYALKEKANDSQLNEAFELYMKVYEELICQDTFLYEGVTETLQYLQKKNYQMVICTNKPYLFVEPILEKLELKQFFTTWIGEHSLPTKKPDAAPLLFLAKKIGASVDECVMVGDSKNDILAAQNAQIESIGVSYGYNYNESIQHYNPTVSINNFSELKNLF